MECLQELDALANSKRVWDICLSFFDGEADWVTGRETETISISSTYCEELKLTIYSF